MEDGKFYARIHAGDGSGADRTGNRNNNPANVLLANLNTIADDNTRRQRHQPQPAGGPLHPRVLRPGG